MMRESYEDIINLPHHISSKHPPMPIENRAAQFSPFAALTGYEECIKEAERLTDKKRELDENEKEILDRKLHYIRTQCGQKVNITWFIPDKKKDGGAYETLADFIKRIEGPNIIMKNGVKIPMEYIVGIDLIDEEDSGIRKPGSNRL